MHEFIDINTGASVDRASRLRQSVTTILTTPINSMVMRREFGSRILELIDQNVTTTWLTSLYGEVAQSIARWEPDFHVTRIQHAMPKPGDVRLHIDGVDRLTGESIKLENITL